MKRKKWVGVACVVACMAVLGFNAYADTIFDRSPVDEVNIVGGGVSGKITDELQGLMETTSEEKICVYVWQEDIDTEAVLSSVPASLSREVDEEQLTVQEYLQEKRSYFKEAYSTHNYSLLESFFGVNLSSGLLYSSGFSQALIEGTEEIEFVSTYSPMIILNLTPDQICNIADEEQVLEVGVVHNDVVSEQSIAEQVIQANYVQTNYGYTGAGVAVGLLEASGIPDVTDSQLENANIIPRETDTTVDDHATKVATVLVGADYGIAPNCTLYAVDVSNFYADVEWLLDRGVSVINCSLGYSSTKEYAIRDMWVDHIDMNHNVLFIKSSGNYGEVTSPGMAYNGITVGGYDDNGTLTHSDDSLMDYYLGSTRVISGYAENNGLAEKPDLVAPSYISFSNFPSAKPGTSYAAPMVTGTVALMIEANPDLKDEPGVLKSILLASAFRKLDSTSYNIATDDIESAWISDSEGVGKLDAKNALYVLLNNRHKYEYLYDYMFPYTSSFYVEASESQIRVALCWLKQNVNNNGLDDPSHNTSTLTEKRELSNLDLEIYDPSGNLVGYSNMDNGNVEIVEFDPTVTGWYTIKVIGTDLKTSKDFIYLAWW